MRTQFHCQSVTFLGDPLDPAAPRQYMLHPVVNEEGHRRNHDDPESWKLPEGADMAAMAFSGVVLVTSDPDVVFVPHRNYWATFTPVEEAGEPEPVGEDNPLPTGAHAVVMTDAAGLSDSASVAGYTDDRPDPMELQAAIKAVEFTGEENLRRVPMAGLPESNIEPATALAYGNADRFQAVGDALAREDAMRGLAANPDEYSAHQARVSPLA